MAILVSGRALGSRRPLFADWSIPLPPDDFGGGAGLTLRDLISRIVRAEVEAFTTRQEARRLDRVLSREDIARAAASGKVAPEGREPGGIHGVEHARAPDPADAIDTALQAFEDGLYLVLLDEQERRDLDEQVFVKPDSRITFLRLVFLAGA